MNFWLVALLSELAGLAIVYIPLYIYMNKRIEALRKEYLP